MIRFPTTPEAFIADQEQLMGRKLSEGEREVTVDFAEVFNLIYEDGLRQDHAVLDRDLDKLDEFMSAIETICSYANLPKRAVFG